MAEANKPFKCTDAECEHPSHKGQKSAHYVPLSGLRGHILPVKTFVGWVTKSAQAGGGGNGGGNGGSAGGSTGSSGNGAGDSASGEGDPGQVTTGGPDVPDAVKVRSALHLSGSARKCPRRSGESYEEWKRRCARNVQESPPGPAEKHANTPDKPEKRANAPNKPEKHANASDLSEKRANTPDAFEEARKELGADKVDTFLAAFGLGPKYKPKPRKTHKCPHCGQPNAYYREEHPDTDMNEMVLHCPDCGHAKESAVSDGWHGVRSKQAQALWETLQSRLNPSAGTPGLPATYTMGPKATFIRGLWPVDQGTVYGSPNIHTVARSWPMQRMSPAEMGRFAAALPPRYTLNVTKQYPSTSVEGQQRQQQDYVVSPTKATPGAVNLSAPVGKEPYKPVAYHEYTHAVDPRFQGLTRAAQAIKAPAQRVEYETPAMTVENVATMRHVPRERFEAVHRQTLGPRGVGVYRQQVAYGPRLGLPEQQRLLAQRQFGYGAGGKLPVTWLGARQPGVQGDLSAIKQFAETVRKFPGYEAWARTRQEPVGIKKQNSLFGVDVGGLPKRTLSCEKRTNALSKVSSTAAYEKYIAVDLDGTLAEDHGFKGPDVIGKPVPKMVTRVKRWLRDGEQVKIMTARVADDPGNKARNAIKDWCKEHLGQELEVTNEKDPAMIELWDDRVREVKKNTGVQQKRASFCVLSPCGEKRATLRVAIADTPQERMRGLSKVGAMAGDEGMLFTQAGGFWMKDVSFPLDIIFMDKQGTVLEWQRMDTIKPGDRPKTYYPTSEKAALALEVPAGWCDEFEVVTGDKLRLDREEA